MASKIILVAMPYPLASMAFSHVAHTTRRQMRNNNFNRFSTLDRLDVDIDKGEPVASSFNPLGPPDFLFNLSVENLFFHTGRILLAYP